MNDLPAQLQINAWAGPQIGNSAPVAADLGGRLLRANKPPNSHFHRPVPVDPRDWRHPAVGWGLVLPDDDRPAGPGKAGLWPTDPAPLAALLAARGDAPVLRWNRDAPAATLRRYDDAGGWRDVSWQALNHGVGPGRMPRYLLICAAPSEIPWRVQYALQFANFVGRLDLAGTALENHVQALVTDWAGAAIDPLAQLLWAVVHDAADITWLLRESITAPLARRLADDGAYAPALLTDADANAARLIAGLAAATPGLVVTSSHGATYPLNDPLAMSAVLGLPADNRRDLLDPAALLAAWAPDGAIWYAHACCSAGANGASSFLDYVAPGSDVARVLQGVAACDSITAPLPRALLGARRPLRAFIGHVEPTFDWTLRNPDTRQFMTMPLMDTLYTRLFSDEPVGMALDSCRRASAALTGGYQHALGLLGEGGAVRGELLRMQLAARDWDSMVLLGDPAVTLAPAS